MEAFGRFSNDVAVRMEVGFGVSVARLPLHRYLRVCLNAFCLQLAIRLFGKKDTDVMGVNTISNTLSIGIFMSVLTQIMRAFTSSVFLLRVSMFFMVERKRARHT